MEQSEVTTQQGLCFTEATTPRTTKLTLPNNQFQHGQLKRPPDLAR